MTASGCASTAPPWRRAGRDGQELTSEGVVRGAVQVPPGGQPVLFLADHPVTGGYPVVAVLATPIRRPSRPRPSPGQAILQRASNSREADVATLTTRRPPHGAGTSP